MAVWFFGCKTKEKTTAAFLMERIERPSRRCRTSNRQDLNGILSQVPRKELYSITKVTVIRLNEGTLSDGMMIFPEILVVFGFFLFETA